MTRPVWNFHNLWCFCPTSVNTGSAYCILVAMRTLPDGTLDTVTLPELSAFVGAPEFLVQRWAVRGWLECAEGGGRQRVERRFNLRQVRQAYVLGQLLQGASSPNSSGWMKGTQLREVLRRMPNRPANEPLYLVIERQHGRLTSAKWTNDPQVAMVAVFRQGFAGSITNTQTGNPVLLTKPALLAGQSVSMLSIPAVLQPGEQLSVVLPQNDKRPVAAGRKSKSVSAASSAETVPCRTQLYRTTQVRQSQKRRSA